MFMILFGIAIVLLTTPFIAIFICGKKKVNNSKTPVSAAKKNGAVAKTPEVDKRKNEASERISIHGSKEDTVTVTKCTTEGTTLKDTVKDVPSQKIQKTQNDNHTKDAKSAKKQKNKSEKKKAAVSGDAKTNKEKSIKGKNKEDKNAAGKDMITGKEKAVKKKEDDGKDVNSIVPTARSSFPDKGGAQGTQETDDRKVSKTVNLTQPDVTLPK